MSGSHSPSAPELPGDSTQRSAIAAEYAQPTPVPVRQLRLWPGVVIVAMEWAFVFVPAWLELDSFSQIAPVVFGPSVATLALVGWWLFCARQSSHTRNFREFRPDSFLVPFVSAENANKF